MRQTTENLGKFRLQIAVAAREWARLICAVREGERGPTQVRIEHGAIKALDDVVVCTPLANASDRVRRYQVKRQNTPLGEQDVVDLLTSLGVAIQSGENSEVVMAIQELVTVDGMELRHLRSLAARLAQPGAVREEVAATSFAEERRWIAWVRRKTGLDEARALYLLSRFSIERLGSEAEVRESTVQALAHTTRDPLASALLLESFVMRHVDGAVRFDMGLAEEVLSNQWKVQVTAQNRSLSRAWVADADQIIPKRSVAEVAITATFEFPGGMGACTVVVPTSDLEELRHDCSAYLEAIRNDARTAIQERDALLRHGPSALALASSSLRERAAERVKGHDFTAYAAVVKAASLSLSGLALESLAPRLARKKHPVGKTLVSAAAHPLPLLPQSATAVNVEMVGETDAVLLFPVLSGALLARAVVLGDVEPGYRLLRPKLRLVYDIDTKESRHRQGLP